MSCLIFHPSTAPFVQHAARALYEADQLDRFVTTLRDDPASFHQRVLHGLGRIANRNLGAQFRRRAVIEVPLGKVRAHPWGELLRLAVGAVDRDGRVTDLIWEKTELAFDRWVSRSLPPEVCAVYGFEHSSLATFTRARELGLRIAYDVPAPDSAYTQALLAREIEQFPELRTAYRRHTAAREPRRLARRRAEWQSADIVIAASAFTKQSYARAGLDIGKVHVVPYGAPPPASLEAIESTARPQGALRLICAGTFSVRKGARYVLEAWRAGRLGRHAELHVFGAIGLPDQVLRPLPDGVHLHGSVSRADLLREFQRADALLFPTLCDGFGMVVTEAWSRGLPVITTDRAGAADLLKPWKNGLLIPAGSAPAILEGVEWCIDHRPELFAMREAAHATARAWQWSDYRRTLVDVLRANGFFAPTPISHASLR